MARTASKTRLTSLAAKPRVATAWFIDPMLLDEEGRPSFNALQNYGSSPAPVVYYVFDVMVLAGQDIMREPLSKRRELLQKKVLPRLAEPIRYSAPLDADLPVLVQSVKLHGFEGVVAKRLNSVYEPGLRTGAWMKMRVNRAQEFVIGGYMALLPEMEHTRDVLWALDNYVYEHHGQLQDWEAEMRSW